MLFSTTTIVAIASILNVASALPAKRQAAPTDADILQYALTLEHLENAFYKKALSEMPEQMWLDANFTSSFYNQLKYIAHDEEAHVVYLQNGLTAAGAAPVQACEYKFPFTDPKSFVALASVIEGVGVSAYLGAAADITTKAYLTAAASILATEALHQSAERNANGEIPMANPFATPLGLNAVYSIASSFIVSCPSTNAALPVMAYPSLALKSGLPTAPGANVALVPETTPSGTFYTTFVSGLDTVSVESQVGSDGLIMTAVPMNISGQSYAFLTSDNSVTLSDSNIIAGPAIIEVTPGSPVFDLSTI
ncbi:hypothetical protein BCIN_08g04320 [Botrytis cinerea B05.10]|uniref:Uncharacterized protein n=3 Tax=Botryotinia fuckeliana TaxID=40559 RepID=A0A384JQN2_BOTFB|nr:hypothetical protein BCIN_08g04320 [Botrytis cinerea B05.10]ATZ52801.1 hypothetical protein BCIN_08g04320 [Botrytis cinerea B05.10]EMR90621.1 putative protein rds1 protein [Botrytis cinerea BcDW1]CCD51966.1 hypothetical protein BofuT4_P084900.1 [Botrytis cinerea T4]